MRLLALGMRLHSLQEGSVLAPSQREDVDVMAEELARLERIVASFLEFSKLPEPVFGIICVNDVIREAMNVLQPVFAQRRIDAQTVLDAA